MENENMNQSNEENNSTNNTQQEIIQSQESIQPTVVNQSVVLEKPIDQQVQEPTEQPEEQIVQPQPTLSTTAPTKKKSNKALIFVIIGIVLVALAVSGFLLLNKENSDSPGFISKDYIESIINKNYTKAFEYINIPENGFVDANDFSDYIQKKEYFKKLTESKIKTKNEDLLTDNKATYTYVLSDGNGEYNLKINLVKKENIWKVEEKFYIEDFNILIPKDTKLYLDDKLVPTSLIAKTNVGSNNLCDQYVIPAIYESQKKLKVESNFGEYNKDFSTVRSNNNQQITMVLTDADLVKKAQDFIKEMWNDMYVQYKNGTDVAEIKNKYFDDNVSLDLVNTYYKNGFKSMTSNSLKNYSNLKITSIINRTDKEGYDNFISSNDIVTINFGYSVYYEWNFMNQGPYTMNRYSKIRLRYTNGEFKVYEVSDEKFFTYLNQFTHEFK